MEKNIDKEMKYSIVADLILEKLIRNHDKYTDAFPHISNIQGKEKSLEYAPEKNCLWTSSFFPGEMYLAYELSGDESFLCDSQSYLNSFGERLKTRTGMSHDLGFLYTLSCTALYKLTGNMQAKTLAQSAADVLYGRYNGKGRYIQAWGEMNPEAPCVKIIVDTMLNLPLLYWSGRGEHAEAAENHAKTAAKYLVRDDFSSFHTYLMNPESGEAIEGRTHQGYSDSSTWARGQAWVVYGFALSYSYAHNKEFLEVSKRAADYFIERLPSDYVSYWDLEFSDEIPDIRDSSAASILAAGLLELAEYLEGDEKQKYDTAARRILKSLFENYFNLDMDSPVILTDGMYHRNNGSTGTIWGDYFFMESLVRLQTEYKRFW